MEDENKNVNKDEHENESADNAMSKELDNILEGIPKEERHEEKRMIGMSMQLGGIMSPQMELMKKMTPEHVATFLESQREATHFQFQEKRDNKIFSVIVLCAVMVFVPVIIVLLKDKPEVMEKVLYAAGGLVAGCIGGYGYGKTKKDD